MKWFLIKIACIAAGYLAGAWVCHDPIGGVLIAPFGWIVGKAVELHATAKKMGITGYRTAVVEGSEEDLSGIFEDPFIDDPACRSLWCNIWNNESEEDWWKP